MRANACAGQAEPVKVFDRHPTLNDPSIQIINYKTSSDEKWMVLIGIKSEVSPPNTHTNRVRTSMRNLSDFSAA